MLYVVSASYDSNLNGIILKLYNDKTEKIEEWIDTDFYAYCLAKKKIGFKGVKRTEVVEKYNALKDENETLWKIVFESPALVKQTHGMPEIWENHIKFFQSYIYDNNIKMGMPYLRENSKLVFQVDEEAEQRMKEILSLIEFPAEDREVFENWAELLEYPAPNFKRASLDIEVKNEEKHIPNAEVANLPILMVCFAGSDGRRIALVLLQEGKKLVSIPENVTDVRLFSSEVDLLLATFELMREYPFILTYNGDDFDLKYLYNRALRWNIPEQKIPINVRSRICMLQRGVHVDLYKFFCIKAMRIYAFKAKYKTMNLDTVAKALLKKGKLEHDKMVGKMSYEELLKYCMNDAELTLELTTYNNNLVMNLIIILERMSRMPIENVSRKAVSSWIRSFMVYEHRRRNFLLPTPEEIKSLKGTLASKAVIKGKKYKGAIVLTPVGGTHFNVLVLDFASLYPSIIKVYNIGYATINCPHEECKTNTIGELPHWLCKKNRAMESQLIGALRDLRVRWYKPQARNKELEKKLKEWYSVAEQSVKVIMNASYGVFGAESFTLYCPPAAEEVTAIARYIISETIKKAQSIGITIIYGDTDSIFAKNPPKDKLEKLIKWTEDKFGIDFEVDKTYRYVCMSRRKKNYFGVLEDGEVDVKGLTAKKKHTPNIMKETFKKAKEVLSKVENPQDMNLAKTKVINIVKKTYNTFRHRSWDKMDDLAFHVTVTKELDEYKKSLPQHVKVARILVKEGYEVIAGTTVSYIKTRKQIKTKTGWRWKGDVKPIELAKKEEVDVGKYIEFLKSTFRQILEPMNVEFEEDILGVTKIEKWM